MSLSLPSAVEALVRHQEGAVTHRQLLERGVSYAVSRRRLDVGHWSRSPYPGVYITYTGRLRPETAIWAALLHAGPGVALSHQTAAVRWQLCERSEQLAPVHLTLPDHRRIRKRSGLVLHYSRDLEHRIHPARSIPITRVEDTVLDLVDAANTFEQVVDWVTRACQSGRTTPELLRMVAGRRARLRWRKQLAGLLGDVSEGARSPLELTYLRGVERAHHLPPGRRQRHRLVSSASQWIDIEYEKFRLLVELDGRIGHIGAERFRDHRRDNASTIRGFDTLRYGWADTVIQRCRIACEVSVVLVRNGWAAAPRRCSPACTVDLETR